MGIIEKKVYEVHCDKCPECIENGSLKQDWFETVEDAMQGMAYEGWSESVRPKGAKK